MPYRKEIGKTPYYVPVYESRYFKTATCDRIYQSLRGIGIDVHKSKGAVACELTYLDSYSAHVEDLSKPQSFLKTFASAFL